MLAALTGLGLSTAAGLNAYIPLLVVGLIANFTDQIRLPQEFAWLSNGWVLGIIGVLLLAEVVLDKVPVVDVNDMIQTFVRPAAGGVVQRHRRGGPGSTARPGYATTPGSAGCWASESRWPCT